MSQHGALRKSVMQLHVCACVSRCAMRTRSRRKILDLNMSTTRQCICGQSLLQKRRITPAFVFGFPPPMAGLCLRVHCFAWIQGTRSSHCMRKRFLPNAQATITTSLMGRRRLRIPTMQAPIGGCDTWALPAVQWTRELQDRPNGQPEVSLLIFPVLESDAMSTTS